MLWDQLEMIPEILLQIDIKRGYSKIVIIYFPKNKNKISITVVSVDHYMKY